MLECCVAALAFVGLGATAVAHAAPVTAAAIFSDIRDPVARGNAAVFDVANGDRILASGTPAKVEVNIDRPLESPGVLASLDFAAPPGQSLAPGIYDRAEGDPIQAAGRPFIDIWTGGQTCVGSGRFEVKDIAFDAAGAVQRLWVVFEQHCGPLTAGLFGEVRVGIDAPAGAVVPESTIARWSVDELQRPRPPVPVVLRAAAPLQVTSASVGGPDAADFAVSSNECNGVSLAAGASCRVWVTFTPTAVGTRTATLDVADSTGGAATVALQGWSHGGTTRVVLDSDPGEYVGAGEHQLFTPLEWDINAFGTAQEVRFFIIAPDGVTEWDAGFGPGADRVLAPGDYDPAIRWGFSDPRPGLAVSGSGRGCNRVDGRFTVTDASYDTDGSMRTFGATFEQHCEGTAPALRGEFDFRVGDAAIPAPWMDPAAVAPAAGTAGASAAPDNAGAGAAPQTATAGGAPAVRRPASASVPIAGRCAGARFRGAHVRVGSARRDVLDGGRTADVLLGGAGDDALRGAAGADCLDGGRAADHLSGGSGADVLVGAAGDDVLDGGPGRDALYCGPGRDIARVTRGDRVYGCERVLRSGPTRRAARVGG
jgi:hypothetical protein